MAVSLNYAKQILSKYFVGTLGLSDFKSRKDGSDTLVCNTGITLKNLNADASVSISVTTGGSLEVSLTFKKKMTVERHGGTLNEFNGESPWLSAHINFLSGNLVVRYATCALSKKELLPNVKGAIGQFVQDKMTERLKKLLNA